MAFSLYGQEFPQSNDMRKSLDFMFEHLDRNSVPKGLLRDYAVEYEDLVFISPQKYTSISIQKYTILI